MDNRIRGAFIAAGVASLVFLGAACNRDETDENPVDIENSSAIDDGTTPFGPYEPEDSAPDGETGDAEGDNVPPGDDDAGTGDND